MTRKSIGKLFQVNNKEIIQVPRYWPFVGESLGDRWITQERLCLELVGISLLWMAGLNLGCNWPSRNGFQAHTKFHHFSEAPDSPLAQANACRRGCERRLWNSLFSPEFVIVPLVPIYMRTAQIPIGEHPYTSVVTWQAVLSSQIAKFTGPTWGPPRPCRPQMGPMLALWNFAIRDWFHLGCNFSSMLKLQRRFE